MYGVRPPEQKRSTVTMQVRRRLIAEFMSPSTAEAVRASRRVRSQPRWTNSSSQPGFRGLGRPGGNVCLLHCWRRGEENGVGSMDTIEKCSCRSRTYPSHPTRYNSTLQTRHVTNTRILQIPSTLHRFVQLHDLCPRCNSNPTACTCLMQKVKTFVRVWPTLADRSPASLAAAQTCDAVAHLHASHTDKASCRTIDFAGPSCLAGARQGTTLRPQYGPAARE